MNNEIEVLETKSRKWLIDGEPIPVEFIAVPKHPTVILLKTEEEITRVRAGEIINHIRKVLGENAHPILFPSNNPKAVEFIRAQEKPTVLLIKVERELSRVEMGKFRKAIWKTVGHNVRPIFLSDDVETERLQVEKFINRMLVLKVIDVPTIQKICYEYSHDMKV